MKVLVTGASGGLAEFIIIELLKRKHEVIATARSVEKIAEKGFFSKVTFIPYDLEHPSSADLYTYFNKPDTIIHLAWAKLAEPKNNEHLSSILEQHQVFLSNLIRNGLKDVNIAGTAYEFGLKEGEQKDEDVCNPVVAYGIGKNKLREYLETLQVETSFTLKWLRIFNVFTAGKAGKNLFSQLNTAVANKETHFNMSGGEQIRDYLDAETLAYYFVTISLQNTTVGAINCCSGKPIALKTLVQNYLNQHNFTIKLNLGFYPYLPFEPMQTWGNTAKLNEIIARNA